jgi:hypothetical protein
MDNIHLKNLNSEKTLKELAKNPKAYLFYVFQQNLNNNYPALYMFKQLPIIEEFDDIIIDNLYEITKEKITTIDKIINLIAFEYNNKFKYSYYKRDQIINEKINESLLYYIIEHYLLHSLYKKEEVKQINSTLNKKYCELLQVQLGAADHNSISGIIKTLEVLDKENNQTNIKDLQKEFKNIKATILKHPNIDTLDRIRSYIYQSIYKQILKPFKFTLYYEDLYIYDKIKDIIKESLIALKKLKVLNFDDEIIK